MTKEKNKNTIIKTLHYRLTKYAALVLLLGYIVSGKIFDLGTNIPCWLNQDSCGSADALATAIQFIPVAILSTLICLTSLLPVKMNLLVKIGIITVASILLSGAAWYYYTLAQI